MIGLISLLGHTSGRQNEVVVLQKNNGSYYLASNLSCFRFCIENQSKKQTEKYAMKNNKGGFIHG